MLSRFQTGVFLIARDKVKTNTNVKLYKAMLKSILTYNCGTWALSEKEEAKLDAFHRKQLKQIINIKYPVKITNKSLNKNAKRKADLNITIQIGLFKRSKDILAKKAMETYFVPKGDNIRGRPITSLPTGINKDLCRRPAGDLKFKPKNDLDHLRSTAEDRTQWRRLSANIREAAEASKSEQ